MVLMLAVGIGVNAAVFSLDGKSIDPIAGNS
jgi:hypothetical protein